MAAESDLEATVRELAPRLLRFCFSSTRDGASAEDIAQETLAALVSRWRRLGPPDDCEAFVFVVAGRRLRRQRWKRRLLAPLTAASDTEVADRAHREAEARERLSLVRRLVARLTGGEREALAVSLEDRGTRRSAATLGIGTSAYKMRLHRARARLRRLLEEYDEPTVS